MTVTTPGIRYVTAIAGDPQCNATFSFGDRGETPGTNITFFPWTGRGGQGTFGADQTQDTASLIHPDAVEYWVDRIEPSDVNVGRSDRFVETDAGRGQIGVRTVHHTAFKATDGEEQERWRNVFSNHSQHVTDVIDRKYFESIHSREPGGVLFEMATLSPGFTVDEDLDELGSRLPLPEWSVDERERIEARLPEFESGTVGAGGE